MNGFGVFKIQIQKIQFRYKTKQFCVIQTRFTLLYLGINCQKWQEKWQGEPLLSMYWSVKPNPYLPAKNGRQTLY